MGGGGVGSSMNFHRGSLGLAGGNMNNSNFMVRPSTVSSTPVDMSWDFPAAGDNAYPRLVLEVCCKAIGLCCMIVIIITISSFFLSVFISLLACLF